MSYPINAYQEYGKGAYYALEMKACDQSPEANVIEALTKNLTPPEVLLIILNPLSHVLGIRGADLRHLMRMKPYDIRIGRFLAHSLDSRIFLMQLGFFFGWFFHDRLVVYGITINYQVLLYTSDHWSLNLPNGLFVDLSYDIKCKSLS
ncbi:hypothetical protein VNO77_27805 [Canavalia gladiata]|uniref:Uncharacterized protein n=1 Tax=Canavalia gladiata TaxID=3824 RepID=A0AAN9QAU7_CANGL